MWTCPKCGRNFRNCNQSHYCGKAPETIEEYIQGQPEEVQPILRQLQETIHGAIPEAKEKISWSMPTFWMQPDPVCGIPKAYRAVSRPGGGGVLC